MEQKRKQYRLNLAFRATDQAHTAAYKRLVSMPKSTDYIVALMTREQESAQRLPVTVDVEALSSSLLPLIEEVVAKVVSEALRNRGTIPLQEEETVSTPGTIPHNMELGLKGLEAFYSD